jgi:hypothetical protein
MAKASGGKPQRRALSFGGTAMSVLPARFDEIKVGNGFALTINGLVVSGSPDANEWEKVGERLRVFERASQFALGDFLNLGEERLGEDAFANIYDAESGWARSTCENYRWLAKSIAVDRRRMDRLGIRHHQLVAHLSATEQKKWLTRAANDDGEPWTVAQLAAALAGDDLLAEGSLWLLVGCETEEDRASLEQTMQAQGRATKAVAKRRRKDKES